MLSNSILFYNQVHERRVMYKVNIAMTLGPVETVKIIQRERLEQVVVGIRNKGKRNVSLIPP